MSHHNRSRRDRNEHTQPWKSHNEKAGSRKPIMVYTEKELRERQRHLGSTRSILDRKKFAKEFDVRSLNLNEEERRVWDENPHMQQVFANGRKFHRVPAPFSFSNRIITDKSPRTPYSRRQGEAKTVEHWGQRKLLFSEIEFLTVYSKPGYTVVYAGAAPGAHTNFLAKELFPDLQFVLVDPARFDAWETDKIEIINDFFTDDLAAKYSGRDDILFISDIRSMSHAMTDEEKEERVQVDMANQRRWHEIIKPRASMFKFRLPYVVDPHDNKTTEYFDGVIFLPVWGGRTTTETRLVVTDNHNTFKHYHHKEYEDVMFHFNTETRTSYHPHNVEGQGLDHCFDCTSEIFVLSVYFRKFHGITDEDLIRVKVAEMSSRISRNISLTGRTLVIDERHAVERRREKD